MASIGIAVVRVFMGMRFLILRSHVYACLSIQWWETRRSQMYVAQAVHKYTVTLYQWRLKSQMSWLGIPQQHMVSINDLFLIESFDDYNVHWSLHLSSLVFVSTKPLGHSLLCHCITELVELYSTAYEFEAVSIRPHDRTEIPLLLKQLPELPQDLFAFGFKKRRIIFAPKRTKARFLRN